MVSWTNSQLPRSLKPIVIIPLNTQGVYLELGYVGDEFNQNMGASRSLGWWLAKACKSHQTSYMVEVVNISLTCPNIFYMLK